jgi:superoxide dismutase, Fe-Mn family
MEHTLPALPFAMDALAPHMSQETFEYHYGKHHQAYVTNLNNLIKGTDFESRTLEDIVKSAPAGGIYNNAAQVWNHSFFWNCLKPNGGGAPSGALADAINAKWGSYDEFKKAFQTSAVGNFGSGWTWLVKKADGSVDIVNMGAAGTPLTTGDTALLCIDVWEHAYYIDYRNLRPKFVETFLNNLVNWKFAEANFAKKQLIRWPAMFHGGPFCFSVSCANPSGDVTLWNARPVRRWALLHPDRAGLNDMA